MSRFYADGVQSATGARHCSSIVASAGSTGMDSPCKVRKAVSLKTDADTCSKIGVLGMMLWDATHRHAHGLHTRTQDHARTCTHAYSRFRALYRPNRKSRVSIDSAEAREFQGVEETGDGPLSAPTPYIMIN